MTNHTRHFSAASFETTWLRPPSGAHTGSYPNNNNDNGENYNKYKQKIPPPPKKKKIPPKNQKIPQPLCCINIDKEPGIKIMPMGIFCTFNFCFIRPTFNGSAEHRILGVPLMAMKNILFHTHSLICNLDNSTISGSGQP